MVKKFLSIAGLFLTISAVLLSSCKKAQTTPNIQQRLIGKWTLKMATGSYTELGTNHKDTTRFTSADFFQFNSDGTLNITVSNTPHNGIWKIGSSNKLFITGTNYVDYANGFDVPVITNTDLQLYYTETNANASSEQKLFFNKQ